jgi:hypothetical protein
VQRAHAADTGLFPDYILDPTGAAAPAVGSGFDAEDGAYFWNACRVPWRVGVHFLASGDPRARGLLQPLNEWARTATGGDPLAFASGYALDGSVLAEWDFPSMAFIAPLGVSAMVDADNQDWLDAIWDATVAFEPEGYFEDSIKLLAMIAMSEAWWTPELPGDSCE